MLFDWPVTGQVVATNLVHDVRGPTHVVKTGKTTVLDARQARKLLDSIRITRTVALLQGMITQVPCIAAHQAAEEEAGDRQPNRCSAAMQ